MEKITVTGQTRLDIQMAWEVWTNPSHLIHWTFASPDWHSPSAKSDLKTDGRFLTRMEAKDGSVGFDFEGTFIRLEVPHLLEYRMDDGREVLVTFQTNENGTLITETFDPENIHSPELQKNGWQAIMDNYVSYADGLVQS